MASKYLKNDEGIVRAITTNNLKLEKPMLNENYDIDVHNRNMDKIDNAIQEVKGKVDGLELTAQRVSIADSTNKFEATNVEDALLENKTSILNLNSKTDTMNSDLSNLKTRVDNGQNVKITEDNGACRGIPSNDANNIETTGFWMGSNVANAPSVTHDWVYIESKVHNNLYQIQIATDLHNSEKRWTRHKTSGTWSEWRSL